MDIALKVLQGLPPVAPIEAMAFPNVPELKLAQAPKLFGLDGEISLLPSENDDPAKKLQRQKQEQALRKRREMLAPLREMYSRMQLKYQEVQKLHEQYSLLIVSGVLEPEAFGHTKKRMVKLEELLKAIVGRLSQLRQAMEMGGPGNMVGSVSDVGGLEGLGGDTASEQSVAVPEPELFAKQGESSAMENRNAGNESLDVLGAKVAAHMDQNEGLSQRIETFLRKMGRDYRAIEVINQLLKQANLTVGDSIQLQALRNELALDVSFGTL